MARLPAVTRDTVTGYVATYAACVLALFAVGFWAVVGRDRVAFFASFAIMVIAFIIVSMVENASKRLLRDDGFARTRGAEIAAAAKTARTMTFVSTAVPLIGYALFQFGGRSFALLAVLGACAIVWLVLSIASPAHIVRKFG
jgi:3-methyladenine DNA glycosylase Tag